MRDILVRKMRSIDLLYVPGELNLYVVMFHMCVTCLRVCECLCVFMNMYMFVQVDVPM